MPLTSLTSAPSQRLLELFRDLARPQPLGDLLATILEATTDLLDCERASMLLYDPASEQLRFVAATSEDTEALARIPVPLDGSLAGTIFRERRALVVQDVSGDTRHFAEPGDAFGYRPRAIAGVPMILDGETVGVLEALDPNGESFSDADVTVLEAVASQAAIVVVAARDRHSADRAHDRLAARDHLYADVLDAAASYCADDKASPRLATLSRVLHETRHWQQLPSIREVMDWAELVREALPAGAPALLNLSREPLRVVADAERMAAVLAHVAEATRGEAGPDALDVCVDVDGDAVVAEWRGPGLGLPEARLRLAAAALLAERDAATIEHSESVLILRLPSASAD